MKTKEKFRSKVMMFGLALGIISVAFIGKEVKEGQEYNIPTNELIPVKELKNGYTAEQAFEFRNGYSPLNFVMNDDIGTYLLTNLSEILPTAVVKRDGAISELEYNLMPEIGEVVATSLLGDISLSEAMEDERSRIRGYMVMHKGKVVYEEYPGMRPHDIHLWYSSAKVITGLAIHMLAEDGLVDLNASVAEYIPDFKGTAIADATIMNILQHEAGLDFAETRETVTNPDHPVGRANAMLVAARGTMPAESLISILKTVESSGEPGQSFDYSTFNTQLLKLVIENTSQKPWEEFVSERIWIPAGMEGDGLNSLTPHGEPINLFASRLRDKARFGLLFTPSWNVVANEKVVSDNYLTKVNEAGNREAFAKGELGPRQTENFHSEEPPLYSSYHWDSVFEDGDLYKDGRNGQGIYVSPKKDVVVVWFFSSYANSLKIHSYARQIVTEMF